MYIYIYIYIYRYIYIYVYVCKNTYKPYKRTQGYVFMGGISFLYGPPPESTFPSGRAVGLLQAAAASQRWPAAGQGEGGGLNVCYLGGTSGE